MLSLLSLLFWILAVIVAITIHEFSHALAADKLGDPTARISGRLSLNPIKHYDPIGTTMLFATAFMNALGMPIVPLGWAKPVPFDPYNLRNPRRDSALIALAGPVSNILLATLLSFLLHFFFLESLLTNAFLVSNITLNVVLAIFNLVPIHPLDGSKILLGILPRDLAIEYEMIMRQYGMALLLLLILPFAGRSAIGAFLGPIMSFALSLFL